MQRSLTLLTLAALSFIGVNVLRKQRQDRLAAMPRAKPEALQAWEGEGGALPNGAPGPVIAAAETTEDVSATKPASTRNAKPSGRSGPAS